MNKPDLMAPDEVLHWLERFGIPYKVHKGSFVTDGSIMLMEGKFCLKRLKLSIAEHVDALTELVAKRAPEVCVWCHQPMQFGARFVQVYLQDTGKRISLHLKCHDDRREKLPNLPEAQVIADEPGYLLLHEDNGLCCYCQMAEAEYPEEAPNVCNRCWKIRAEKNAKASAGSAGIA